MPLEVPVPDASLLGKYKQRNAFTDCYSTVVTIPVTLPEFIDAFYTTWWFKLERWLLALFCRQSSTDKQVSQLARAQTSDMSVWRVESRTETEILLSAWHTRSWLCVQSEQTSSHVVISTNLLFGSAVIPSRSNGQFALLFHLLGGVHRWYAKCLLAAAAKQLRRKHSRDQQ
ncbi:MULTISPECIES: hypothetical protein [unclassified Vibrio]|uniref:DUF2867 domain-containing protein n=1 Tax=Vibrio sp. HB236076 TaxID=3232307 RepID=A0AB39HDW5_9VIBR|nr:hypothetical protein [Vibrio sp. HB161653]MDP5253806.1 hypothetical protein [Vibrio sp. HB161653]